MEPGIDSKASFPPATEARRVGTLTLFLLSSQVKFHLCTFTLGRGGGALWEIREKIEGQFTRGVENTNMTDCISSLQTLLNTSKDDIQDFVSFQIHVPSPHTSSKNPTKHSNIPAQNQDNSSLQRPHLPYTMYSIEYPLGIKCHVVQ